MDINKCRNRLLKFLKDGKEADMLELANEIGRPVDEVRTAIDNLNKILTSKSSDMGISRKSLIKLIGNNKVRIKKF